MQSKVRIEKLFTVHFISCSRNNFKQDSYQLTRNPMMWWCSSRFLRSGQQGSQRRKWPVSTACPQFVDREACIVRHQPKPLSVYLQQQQKISVGKSVGLGGRKWLQLIKIEIPFWWPDSNQWFNAKKPSSVSNVSAVYIEQESQLTQGWTDLYFKSPAICFFLVCFLRLFTK